MRLDVFLKRVGLVRQRSLAKDICDRGWAKVDGRTAKAGKEVAVGRMVQIQLRDRLLEIEIVDLPGRNYRPGQGEAFYRITKHEPTDPYS